MKLDLRPVFIVLVALASAACGPRDTGADLAHAASVSGGAASAQLEWDDSDCNSATVLQPGVPGSPGHLIVSPRNPNGDSELAHLMRQCVDDLFGARAALQAGRPVEALFERHRKLRCAWSTTPDQRNETFDGMAQGYLMQVRAFDAAPSVTTYDNVVRACVACHSVSCPGPIDMITGLLCE